MINWWHFRPPHWRALSCHCFLLSTLKYALLCACQVSRMLYDSTGPHVSRHTLSVRKFTAFTGPCRQRHAPMLAIHYIVQNEPEHNNSWSTSKMKHTIGNIFLCIIRLSTHYRLQNKYPLRYQRADNGCVRDIYEHFQRRIREKLLTGLATQTGPSIWKNKYLYVKLFCNSYNSQDTLDTIMCCIIIILNTSYYNTKLTSTRQFAFLFNKQQTLYSNTLL